MSESDKVYVELHGAETYHFQGKKYVKGEIYALSEDEANVLLGRGLDEDDGEEHELFFREVSARRVTADRVSKPKTTSAAGAERAARKGAEGQPVQKGKKTVKVSGGKLTGVEGLDGDDDGDGGAGKASSGADGGVEV